MSGNEKLLRRTLQANGCFSLFSGALVLSFASPLAARMGLPDPLWVWLLGPGLLVFGALVMGLGMSRDHVPAGWVKQVIWLDWGWVAGSALVLALFGSRLTSTGVWLIADVALIVGVFAALQQLGLRRAAAGRQISPG